MNLGIQLAAAVRIQRERLGLTQRALAELAGVSTVTISKVEGVQVDVGIGTAEQICAPLGLELSVRLRVAGGAS